ncbi:MAG: RlmE family RNA methyltransferase [Deltaproteobacteria bacterium]|nr:RlmE family RNA methyltransferase [Deltaproteobacteria bacterium]
MARYVKKDAFHQKAKRESFAARSVYKLDEIDARFKIIRKNDRVVDLGAAPGSWLQYLARAVGPGGLVLGYDLVPISVDPGPSVRARAVDVLSLTAREIRVDAWIAMHPGAPAPDELSLRFDVLLSDLAPKTTGIRDADQARSGALVEAALALAIELLDDDGVFVAKVFQGRGFDELLVATKRAFKETRVLKPEATRDGSRESFFIARGRRPPAG